jgi:hypothetical protein
MTSRIAVWIEASRVSLRATASGGRKLPCPIGKSRANGGKFCSLKDNSPKGVQILGLLFKVFSRCDAAPRPRESRFENFVSQ